MYVPLFCDLACEIESAMSRQIFQCHLGSSFFSLLFAIPVIHFECVRESEYSRVVDSSVYLFFDL